MRLREREATLVKKIDSMRFVLNSPARFNEFTQNKYNKDMKIWTPSTKFYDNVSLLV